MWNKKIIILTLNLILIGSSISPVADAEDTLGTEGNSSHSVQYEVKGTLYVGGGGTGNYSSIQAAVDAAREGDTVYVFDDSSPYDEHVVVDTSIQLIGENKDTTVIDGNWSGTVVNVTADFVYISGFTIQYGVIGVSIHSYNITIEDTIIHNNHEEGIYLEESIGSVLRYNTITYNEDGIELENTFSTLVIKNNISNNADYGIEVGNADNEAAGNLIKNNHFELNVHGIYLENSRGNLILRNNFIDNSFSASFVSGRNTWRHNYWDAGRLLPKVIFGKIAIGSVLVPWINIDWHPASIPNIWYKTIEALIDSSMGVMTLNLYYEIMPITTTNFKQLADIQFFNGLVFHRVIEDFVIQGGGYFPNGTHKESPFGPIALETQPDVLHVDGAISMARTSDPNSATSQFFICDTAQPHLDGAYAAFGKIIDGFEVLQAIAAVETTTKFGLTNWPVDDVIINSIVVEDW